MGEVCRSTGTWLDRTIGHQGQSQRHCLGRVLRPGRSGAVDGTVRAQQAPIEAVESVPSQTIGVMPFANISRVDADQWIGAGIAETLAADLQNRPGIEVLDLGAVRQPAWGRAALDGDVLDDGAALQIAREHGVTWLIAGGYQRVGDRLRITVRLVEVGTGSVRHTVRVDGSIDELFVLQDRVVEAVGTQLGSSGRTTRTETTTRVPVPVDQPDLVPAAPAETFSPPPAATAVATPAIVEEAALLAYEGPPPHRYPRQLPVMRPGG